VSPDGRTVPPGAVLIDTSAWIQSFHSSGPPDLHDYIRRVIKARLAATCAIVDLELFSGCRSREEFAKLKTALEAQHRLEFEQPVWALGYETAFSLRRKGITVPTVDILIASLALHHQVVLAHHDSHFELIKKVLSGLKTVHFLPT